jgi:hypothetical protein
LPRCVRRGGSDSRIDCGSGLNALRYLGKNPLTDLRGFHEKVSRCQGQKLGKALAWLLGFCPVLGRSRGAGSGLDGWGSPSQNENEPVKRRWTLVETNPPRNSWLETHQDDEARGGAQFGSVPGCARTAHRIDRFRHAWKNSFPAFPRENGPLSRAESQKGNNLDAGHFPLLAGRGRLGSGFHPHCRLRSVVERRARWGSF